MATLCTVASTPACARRSRPQKEQDPWTLDAAVKHHFLWIAGTMIASAAYFQASGVSHLIGRTIIPDRATRLASTPLASHRALRDGLTRRALEAILQRNPFDSATGPLLPPPGGAPEERAPAAHGDPWSDPTCDAGRVVLIRGVAGRRVVVRGHRGPRRADAGSAGSAATRREARSRASRGTASGSPRAAPAVQMQLGKLGEERARGGATPQPRGLRRGRSGDDNNLNSIRRRSPPASGG